MTSRHGIRRDSTPAFNVPPPLEHKLEKMGLSGEIRNIKRAMKGDSPTLREMERLSPPTASLSAVFRLVSPKLSSELIGRIVARFWDSLYYALALTENLHEMSRIKGRSRRHDLKLLLEVIQEGALAGQRRQVEGLRRDIPRLLTQLEPRNSRRAKPR
jgi:hypothetical protein